jgi:toluene monooxygenase system protein E
MNPRELRAARAQNPVRRTYWCLEESRKKPSDYEVTTTALLYYPARGFEVKTPVWEHYVRYQQQSVLHCRNWEAFEDPAHTTYSSYVAERRDQEAFLDRLLERPSAGVTQELRPLLGVLSALRFPLHGLQMVAAYVGALAPSGRISVTAALQAADEMRRIQRICQWLSRSGLPSAQLDALGRELWQQGPAFQPLRRLIEELLVTYDWAQALIALNGVIKPVFDRLWFEHLAGVAERHHEEVLEKILGSLGEDGHWHELWFINLCQVAIASEAGNAEVIGHTVREQRARTAVAAQALLPAFEGLLGDDGERAYIWRELDAALEAHVLKLGASPMSGRVGT